MTKKVGFIQKQFDRLVQKSIINNSSALSGLLGGEKKRDTEQLTGLLFGIVQKRADAFKVVNQYFVNEQNEKVATELDWLFNMPNKPYKMTWIDVKELALLSLDFYGNAILWLDKANTSKLVNVYVLPYKQVSIKTDKYSVPIQYVLNEGTLQEQKIDPIDIIHIKTNFIGSDPSTWTYKGYAKHYEAIEDIAESEQFANEEIANIYKNSGMNVMLASKDSQMSETQWEALKKSFTDKFPKASLLLGEDGLQFTPITQQVGGLLDKAMKGSLTEDTIIKLGISYGVPAALAMNEFVSYASAKVIQAEFRNNTIEPLLVKFESAFNIWLTENGYKYKMTHDRYQYEDDSVSIARTQMLLGANAITINEARTANGLAPLENAIYNELQQPINPQPIDNTAVSKGGSDGLAPKNDTSIVPPTAKFELVSNNDTVADILFGKKKELDLNTELNYEAKMLAEWKAFDNLTNKYQSLIQKHYKRLLNTIKSEVLGKVKHYTKEAENVSQKGFADLNIDIEKYLKVFLKYAESDLYDLSFDTIESMLKDLNLDGSDIANDYDKVLNTSMKESADKIKLSLETLDKTIRDVVKETIDTASPDLTNAELRKLIKEQLSLEFDSISANRTETIAKTTANTGTNATKDGVIEKNGLVKQWLHSRGASEKPRPHHQQAEGKEADKNGYFNIGGNKTKYPNGFGIAAEDINCNCTIIARKKK